MQKEEVELKQDAPRSTFAQIYLQENLFVTIRLEEFEPEFAAAVEKRIPMVLGDVFVNLPKKVGGIGRNKATGDLVYFCSWV